MTEYLTLDAQNGQVGNALLHSQTDIVGQERDGGLQVVISKKICFAPYCCTDAWRRTFIAASSLETTKWSAPRVLTASVRLLSLVDSTVTSQPMAFAIFTACQNHEHTIQHHRAASN